MREPLCPVAQNDVKGEKAVKIKLIKIFQNCHNLQTLIFQINKKNRKENANVGRIRKFLNFYIVFKERLSVNSQLQSARSGNETATCKAVFFPFTHSCLRIYARCKRMFQILMNTKVVLSLNSGKMKIFKNKPLIIIYLMQAFTSEKKKILLSRGLQFIIGFRLVFFFLNQHT